MVSAMDSCLSRSQVLTLSHAHACTATVSESFLANCLMLRKLQKVSMCVGFELRSLSKSRSQPSSGMHLITLPFGRVNTCRARYWSYLLATITRDATCTLDLLGKCRDLRIHGKANSTQVSFSFLFLFPNNNKSLFKGKRKGKWLLIVGK